MDNVLKKFAIILVIAVNSLIASSNKTSTPKKSVAKKVASENSKEASEAKLTASPLSDLSSTIIIRNINIPGHYKNVFVSGSGEIIGSYEVCYPRTEPHVPISE
jgi:hypothetical protein